MANQNVFNSKEHFDTIAAHYNNSNDGKFVQPMYDALLREISACREGNLLDVGCGNGNILSRLTHTDLKLYGIDLSGAMIAQARRRLADRAALYTANVEELPFEAGFFDILACNASFHHYPRPEAALREMRRVMKANAVLLLGEIYVPQPIRFFVNLSFRYSTNGDYHIYGRRELNALLQHCGFSSAVITKTGFHSLLYLAYAR